MGRVLAIEELAEFKKPIRYCRVAVGPDHGHPDTPGERGIICALPDGVLRFTPHWPNNPSEIPFVLESIDQILSILHMT